MIAFTPSLTFRLILNPLSVRRVTPTALISLFMDFASVGTRDSFTLYFRSDTACSHLPSSHIAAPGVSPSQGACRAAAPSLSATDAICLSRRARGSGLRKIIRHTDPYILISSAGLIQRASSPTFFISPAGQFTSPLVLLQPASPWLLVSPLNGCRMAVRRGRHWS